MSVTGAFVARRVVFVDTDCVGPVTIAGFYSAAELVTGHEVRATRSPAEHVHPPPLFAMLRFERDELSVVKWLRQATKEYAPSTLPYRYLSTV